MIEIEVINLSVVLWLGRKCWCRKFFPRLIEKTFQIYTVISDSKFPNPSQSEIDSVKIAVSPLSLHMYVASLFPGCMLICMMFRNT